jgi:type IV secretory pathway VirB4 component
MDQAILETYALKGITMETVSPGLKTPPTMEDLQSILENSKGGETLAKRLKQYTTGIFAGIFNKPTNVDLKKGLVVFSIRDLDDILRPTAMYIILNYIWNRVRSQLKRRILVIEEAWTLMQHQDSARFLYGLVKRARKYYLGITTITQDVEDFLSHELGKPIVTNSALQLLLKQAPAAVKVLKNLFNLSEGEEYYLLNSQQGEGIFFAGRKHVAIQIVSSFNEHRLVTTNPEEILKLREEEQSFEAK